MSKVCTKCNVEKDEEEFYVVEKTENGFLRRNPICKICVLEYNRKKYAENPEYKKNRQQREKNRRENEEYRKRASERSKEFYSSISGRAKTLFKSAKRRTKKFGEFDITVEWIEEKLKRGLCEITGLPFDFSPHPVYEKNPYAPSIDRKDSTKGYTQNNVRIVLWQVNLMRGEMNDSEIFEICKKVLEGLTIERKMDMG